MNLKERYELVSQNLNDLYLSINQQTNGVIQLTGLHKFRDTIHSLGTLKEFKEDVDNLITNTRVFNSAGDGLVINADELSYINSVLNTIKTKAELIQNFFGQDVEISKDMLAIKLPEETTSFGELSKVANQLKLAIEQSVHSMNIEGGILELKSAEPGSIWLIVKLGAAISFIGKLLNKAVYIGNEMQKSTANETYLKQIGADQKYLEQMQELSQKHLKSIIEAQVKALLEGEMKPDDPVLLQTLELSLTTVVELQSKGAKFLPASKDPNITQFFPKETNSSLPFDPSKQLGQ